MPTSQQYEIVKQQCNAFESIGFPSVFSMQDRTQEAAPQIVIDGLNKSWRFCDPDWNVVSKQLSELYKNVKKNTKNAY